VAAPIPEAGKDPQKGRKEKVKVNAAIPEAEKEHRKANPKGKEVIDVILEAEAKIVARKTLIRGKERGRKEILEPGRRRGGIVEGVKRLHR
jgi:hypothetical protein